MAKKTKSTKKKTSKPKKVKPHYVCTGGCKSVSDKPTRCTVHGCYRHRNPLTECKCIDKKHGDLIYKNNPKDEDGKPLPFRNVHRGQKDVLDR